MESPDYAQRLIRIIEENQLFLLDRPDGARLYASRYGLKRDPEEWFSSQSSVEELARTEGAVDPDNYRVTINAHQGYNVYVTNGVHYVLAKENDTFENIGRCRARRSTSNASGNAGRATPGTTSAARAKRPTPWASPTPSARGRSKSSTSSGPARSWNRDARYGSNKNRHTDLWKQPR